MRHALGGLHVVTPGRTKIPSPSPDTASFRTTIQNTSHTNTLPGPVFETHRYPQALELVNIQLRTSSAPSSGSFVATSIPILKNALEERIGGA